MPSRRNIGIGAISVSLLAAIALGLAFEPYAKSRLAAAAQARHLDAQADRVTLGWFALTLHGVRVALPGAPLTVTLREVRVELSPGFSPRRIEAHGGEILAMGSPSSLEAAIRDWRSGRTETPVAGERKPTILVADALSLTWRLRSGDAPVLEVHDATVSRSSDTAVSVSLTAAHAQSEAFALDLGGATARFTATGLLAEARASRVALLLKTESSPKVSDSSANGEPVPPPLPLSSAADGKDPGAAVRKIESLLPELGVARLRLAAIGNLARTALAESFQVDIDALAFEVGDSAAHLSIGHGPLRISRAADALDLRFTTQADAAGTPLSLSTTLPFGPGDALASISGGPISLASLGVDEGAGGLVDVGATTVTGRARVSLPAAAEALTFDGELAVRALAIDRPSIAKEVVRGIDATILARGALDDHGALRIDDAELALGSFHLRAHGSVAQAPDHFSAALSFEVPTTGCQALLLSIPSAMVPTLDGAEIAGSLGARGTLAFDSRALDDLALDWKVDDRCSLSVVPEAIDRARFTQPFEHTIYLPDGTLAQETTGPSTDDWTDLAHISPFMQVAVLTTEDGAFYRHHGFNRGAMRNALVADLKAQRFARGASTITMQLAKNLFLFREKTLARKLEEIILADYLEDAFTKKEMMELYLNVIEFGPNVYGVTQAAFHYFGRKPDELDLAESLFLASLLPSPLRFHKLAEKPALSDGWMKHLRQLMAIAARNELLSTEELEEGLKEEVLFHDPKAPLPPPRAAITETHFRPPSPEGEVEWQETKGP